MIRMRSLLRGIILNTAVIFFAAQILPGLSYSEDFQVLILAALALGLVNMVVRPVIKLVTLPINLLTLGLFSWLVNVFMLYLVTKLITGFEVSAFEFSGLTYQGLVIPTISLSLFWSYVIASFTIGLLTSVLGWLFD